MRRGLYLLCAGIGIAGLALSIHLAYISSLPYCPPQLSECDVVVTSEYAYFYGVSVALLGAIWFAVAITLSITSYLSTRFGRIFLGWCIIGMLGVAYLVYVEAVLLHAICIYCTFAHVLGAVLTALSVIALKR